MYRSKISNRTNSLARNVLIFAVQTHIETKHNIGWRNNRSRIMYV